MSEIRANTIANAAGTGPSDLTGQVAAKAYVYAEDDATPLKDLNISSGTDNGTGDYDFAFTNNFDSVDYAHLVEALTESGRITGDTNSGKLSSSMGTVVFNDAGTSADNSTSNSVFGDLA